MGKSNKTAVSRNSGRRRRHLRTKDEGPIARCCAILRDQSGQDTIIKNYLRVGGSKRKPCYVPVEFHAYEKNAYYRSLLVGSTFGSMIYLVYLIFSILPGRPDSTMTSVTDMEKARLYLPVFVIMSMITLILRVLSIAYFNSYVLFVQQSVLLSLAALGSYQFRCTNNTEASTYLESGPLTSTGYLPMFLIGVIERTLNSTSTEMRAQIYSHRCEQSVTRASAVNTLSEVINVIFTTILMWNG
jgi:hypothetical protein